MSANLYPDRRVGFIQLTSTALLIGCDAPVAPNLTPALIERSTIELLDPYTWTAIDG